MILKIKFLIIILLVSCIAKTNAQYNQQAAEALIKRLLPNHYQYFIVQPLNAENNKDVFEISSSKNKIVLKGNTGVAVASALYYYLNNYCHVLKTWNDDSIRLPAKLPLVKTIIHKATPYAYRYYLNYCTFNYSMSWWNWKRWEQEIDWMALHGINMPLAITGEEYTWYLVYKDLGFDEKDLKNFFCGPAYFSWFWMGNLDGWGGPLPLHWMQLHFELQKKILQRERVLGMKPVLPAFTGHVPAAFKNKFPGAKLKETNWNNGFNDTYILDASDSMFAVLGKKFLQKQTELLGTDHLYSADTFNENEPPSDDSAFLSDLSAKVYEGMKQADSSATWVMQGWLFYSNRKFWKEPQTKALLASVPNDKMIILDLATEIEPVWKRTQAFYGKPWIWNMLNNFGGNTNLFGRMETVAAEPSRALHDINHGNLQGIGLTMEAIEQNPAIYELMMANVWSANSINLHTWLSNYVVNRYGTKNEHALKAWNILASTVYSVPQNKYKRDGAESIIQARPTFDSLTHWANTRLNYDAKDLLPAWDRLVQAIPDCKTSKGFQFDLTDVTRQVLVNYALPLQRKFVKAYHEKNINDFNKWSNAFLMLIDDVDNLLATQPGFLLGKWISSARQCGISEAEKALYEMNAKDLITLWGDENCPLNEYACRQWSGLLSDFYKPRWQKFISQLQNSLKNKTVFNDTDFIKNIKQWEWQWVNERKDYPVKTSGNTISQVKYLYKKYRNIIDYN